MPAIVHSALTSASKTPAARARMAVACEKSSRTDADPPAAWSVIEAPRRRPPVLFSYVPRIVQPVLHPQDGPLLMTMSRALPYQGRQCFDCVLRTVSGG